MGNVRHVLQQMDTETLRAMQRAARETADEIRPYPAAKKRLKALEDNLRHISEELAGRDSVVTSQEGDK